METPVKLTYPGPFEAVTILATGQTVKRGESVDVAPEVADRLAEQGWTAPAAKPAKATKATTTKAVKAETEEDA
jgi:hypothetical protein